MPLTLAVGRTPWSAADALVGLPRFRSNIDAIGESVRGGRADQGVRPTINAESQRKWHWPQAPGAAYISTPVIRATRSLRSEKKEMSQRIRWFPTESEPRHA